MNRVILHVDMDAFFAAVEQRDHPDYKGKPVIVGADPKGGQGRGVVSTCSYEARKFGIHSAMPINQAFKRCPHGIYVPPNGPLYKQVSDEIFRIFRRYTDLVEPLSIDEAFLDVTGSARIYGDGPEIARRIKKDIVSEEQLTCSIGVAPNKYLAKIASDLEKPDGLVIVYPDKIEAFLHPLDIGRLWGAGEKTQKLLKNMGIKTFGDLARYPKEFLEMRFGKAGIHFYNLAHGIDNRQVEPLHEVKSISNEHTFEHDVNDISELYKLIMYLSDKVGHRLRGQKITAKTVHLKLRYDDFKTITRNKTLPNYTDLTEIIYETVLELFKHNYQKGRKVRLIGVGVSGFGKNEGEQLNLFDRKTIKTSRIDKLEDDLIKKFGKHIIHRAESLRNRKPSGKN